MKPEERIHFNLADYTKLQYPTVFFISESSGVRTSIGLATKLKRTRSAHTHVDIYFLEPVGKYSGLFLELKDGKDKIFKKNGDYKTEHVENQADTIEKLNKKGYYATFAWSFDMAKEILDDYLHGNL